MNVKENPKIKKLKDPRSRAPIWCSKYLTLLQYKSDVRSPETSPGAHFMKRLHAAAKSLNLPKEPQNCATKFETVFRESSSTPTRQTDFSEWNGISSLDHWKYESNTPATQANCHLILPQLHTTTIIPTPAYMPPPLYVSQTWAPLTPMWSQSHQPLTWTQIQPTWPPNPINCNQTCAYNQSWQTLPSAEPTQVSEIPFPPTTEAGPPTHQYVYINRSILSLFGSPCLNYLNNLACHVDCQFAHTIPSPDGIQPILALWSTQNVKIAYNEFLLKHRLAFAQYFTIFCNEFGNRREANQLFSMLTDLLNFGNANMHSYAQSIFNNTKKCRVSAFDAITMLLSIQRHQASAKYWHVVVTVILEANLIPHFIHEIRGLLLMDGYWFEGTSLQQLIKKTLHLKDKNITLIVGQIVNKMLASNQSIDFDALKAIVGNGTLQSI